MKYLKNIKSIYDNLFNSKKKKIEKSDTFLYIPKIERMENFITRIDSMKDEKPISEILSDISENDTDSEIIEIKDEKKTIKITRAIFRYQDYETGLWTTVIMNGDTYEIYKKITQKSPNPEQVVYSED
jgi:hypothetical protein